MPSSSAAGDAGFPLPLFPLQAVLFPGGLLSLKVFEARYLDLMARCLRERENFGVVALVRGSEVRKAEQPDVAFQPIGTRAEVLDVDSAQTGILLVRCRGGERFRVASSRQQDDGLWVARVEPIEGDEPVAPTAALAGAARGLADAMAALEVQNTRPFLLPHRFDDAGWVANRWCELLPIPLLAKQKLMELQDPLVRLELVDDFLRQKGVLP
jgi:Lon protease-like protein